MPRPSKAPAHPSCNGELQLAVEYLATSSLTVDPQNARKHSKRQLTKLQAVVAEFGFTNPI